jgi:hypothetical protein
MALNSNVKAQKIAAAAAEVVEQGLRVPGLFTKAGVDDFRGAANDTVNIKVPGVLPAHDLTWRSERNSDITLDAYSERTYAVSFQGNVYQATKLQDEQVDFDNLGWQQVVPIQAEAVARNIEGKAVIQLGAPTFPGNSSLAGVSGSASAYSYMVAGAKSGRDLRQSFIAMRRVCNAIGMGPRRTIVTGVGLESAVLDDRTALGLGVASIAGDANASAALREAHIGRVMGFDILVAPELPADKAYVVTPGAFVLATASPSMPQSVPFGATAGARGISLRWMRDYDSMRFVDRSVVNTYVGTRAIPDVIFIRSTNAVSASEYFIRAIAFDLDATADVLPAAASELDAAFGINATAGIGI